MSELAYCGHPMTAPRECGQCLAEARAEVERLREALTRIAGIPDRNGHTHGARLHDVGAMMEEARAALGDGAGKGG